MTSLIKHPDLAPDGELRAEWAEAHMPAIGKIVEEYRGKRPLEGRTISACLHVTKETAVLAKALYDLGAEVALAGSNPLTTQDDVAAHLSTVGINVFAWRGETREEYFSLISRTLDFEPDVVIDDGGDIHVYVHEKRRGLLEGVVGGTEETTTGVNRLRALERAEKLEYPVIAVNDTRTKRILDNKYGTGQSTIDGVLRSTSLLISGKTFVVCGYGWVGRGIARRAQGMGANVVVTEVDPMHALEAHMDGFRVMPMSKAAGIGDFFVTATGQTGVIRSEHIWKMKDGAILANSGHFNVEISLSDLDSLSTERRRIRSALEEYRLRNGRKIYLLGEGRLVNLVAAEGHPPEVMMCSFANQILSVIHLIGEGGSMEPMVYAVPREIDEKVADFTLRGWGIEIDDVTEEQRRYAESWA